jgi:peroxiredoxin
MALTVSNMMPLATIAPDFNLLDVISGKEISLKQYKSDIATVILFICNHCPYVKHIQHELVKLALEYQKKGIQFIAISSNDPQDYPEDSPEKMREIAQEFNYPFPYLFDESQEVAKMYQAACTPDIYVFDRELRCVYRGRFDDSRPGKDIPVTGRDLSTVLDCILQGMPIAEKQEPSIGCNIKWRK